MKAIINLIVFLVLIAPLCGWGLNIYKLCQCDFKAPYNAEIIRGIGIPIPIIGAVTGFIQIKD
jgi:hypothetical protein